MVRWKLELVAKSFNNALNRDQKLIKQRELFLKSYGDLTNAISNVEHNK